MALLPPSLCLVGLLFVSPTISTSCSPAASQPSQTLWTSAPELARIPRKGPAWDALFAAASAAIPSQATILDQNSSNNVEILAAAIVYLRTGMPAMRQKVEAALQQLVAFGEPKDPDPNIETATLDWAREVGAYVLAADLVGYGDPAFDLWLDRVADVWLAEEDGRTLLEMFEERPNNWGAMAFGSLCAIYAYRGQDANLNYVRNFWLQALQGPKPTPLNYGNDLSWHVAPSNPRIVNPVGAVKNGLSIDGILPDDMRRGGAFTVPPGHTDYPWEALQGLVTAARILDRYPGSQPIWSEAQDALRRAVEILEVDYAAQFGAQWKASGDDSWILPFVDDAYGTVHAWNALDPDRVWKAGKIAGWAYVLLEDVADGSVPSKPQGLAVQTQGCQATLTWTDSSAEAAYRIEAKPAGGVWQLVGYAPPAMGGALSFLAEDLLAGTTHAFRITAVNVYGDSPVSSVVSATTGTCGQAVGALSTTIGTTERTWLFELPPAERVTFCVRAHGPDGASYEGYTFRYDAGELADAPLVSVHATDETAGYQSFRLPRAPNGPVRVEVVADATLVVDELFFRVE